MTRVVLPLWRPAIFVDWHGVLSRDPFWVSILSSEKHPLREPLQAKLGEIFSGDPRVSHEWMKGVRSSTDIVAGMGIELDRRYRNDFLRRRLDDDCKRMRVNVELFRVLNGMRMKAQVVVATDNMDCFARVFDQARQGNRRPKMTGEEMSAWASCFDDIVCSSDVRALKSEDPAGFFGPWLAERGLDFSDALLIDDRADNCAAFIERGGSVVQWKMGVGDIAHVTAAIGNWLETHSTMT
jgi:hypothetical protein